VEGGDKLEKVTRYDFIPINNKARKDGNGFIHDTPVITKTGVFIYHEPNGTIRKELRLPEDVFHADSLASYEGVPLTLQHPKGLVNPENSDKIPIVGSVLSQGIQDGNNVKAKIVIQSQKVVNSGMRGLSAGYIADVIPEVGVYEGQEYTHRQTNIRLNHVAVCKNPRAGSIARLNMDSNEIIEEEKETDKMPKFKTDSGLEYEVLPEVLVAINQLKADAASAITKAIEVETAAEIAAKKAQSEMDAKDAKCDTLKAQVDKNAGELEKVKKDAADSIQSAVTTRIEMLKVAEKFKLDKADELSNNDIKLAVIKTVRGDGMDLAGKSEDYIQASFDMCKEDSVTRIDAMAEQRRKANEKLKLDGKGEAQTSDEARQKMIDKTKNAYKGAK